jgi:class 3 adenylate cyclase
MLAFDPRESPKMGYLSEARLFPPSGMHSMDDSRKLAAVRCAIEIQNSMIERNAGLPPERRIEFRIGIHLGDVVEASDGDLMGDGVNIAARLEGVAQPGAICLSEDAYRQVKARLDLAISDLGETKLKNIAGCGHWSLSELLRKTPPPRRFTRSQRLTQEFDFGWGR